ncbi:MAG: DNA-binding response regulator [Candidatus Sericytochromatia bacterium]|nr:MAG: DNA-binding response regulator [Candidatus Sericytochromatia bacterium]
MKEKISVVVLEDNELMLMGISSSLAFYDDIEILATGKNGKEGLELIRKLSPKVSIIDIRMPYIDGIELTKKLRDEKINTNIIILTSLEDEEYLFEAFKNGANAYVLKDIDPEELYNTVKMVSNGLVLMQPAIARNVLMDMNNKSKIKKEENLEHLTEREKEILVLISKGLKNKEISEKLFISEGTVKIHINNILKKLGVNDRNQAIIIAKEKDII